VPAVIKMNYGVPFSNPSNILSASELPRRSWSVCFFGPNWLTVPSTAPHAPEGFDVPIPRAWPDMSPPHHNTRRGELWNRRIKVIDIATIEPDHGESISFMLFFCLLYILSVSLSLLKSRACANFAVTSSTSLVKRAFHDEALTRAQPISVPRRPHLTKAHPLDCISS
jgi:hypothetical protein